MKFLTTNDPQPWFSAFCGSIRSNYTNKDRDASKFVKLLGEDKAFSVATDLELSSVVAHSLEVEGASVSSLWQASHDQTEQRISSFLSEMKDIAVLFDGVDIPVVALKNSGIALGIYNCPGCSPMGDIDLLVSSNNLLKAHNLLLANGFHYQFRNPLESNELTEAQLAGGTEYWKVLKNGEKLWVELQCRSVAGRWLRPDQEPPADELISRAQLANNTKVRILSPEDNLLQVCLHTAKHTYVRAPGLRLHLDVERIVRHQQIDWQVFLAKVILLKVTVPVYFSLLIPSKFFETPIPDYVMDKLAPGSIRRRLICTWLDRCGFLEPNTPKFGRVSYILFNCLLYDDLNGLVLAVFPEKSWMEERYTIESTPDLLVAYASRIFDLVMRRLKT